MGGSWSEAGRQEDDEEDGEERDPTCMNVNDVTTIGLVKICCIIEQQL